MAPTIVVGHKNPDNDSIASAVAYAYLKNETDPTMRYIPARLGPMPKETSWVFERFGVETPVVVPHVHNRVCDVMTSDVITVSEDATMLEAGRALREHSIRCLVVEDSKGFYRGVMTTRLLAELYIAETDIVGFSERPVMLGKLASSLDGSIVAGDPETVLAGSLIIGASEPETVAASIKPGDIVVLGDRKRTQPIALEAGAACIILSCGATPDPEFVEAARARGVAILCSPHDSYTTTRLSTLSRTVGNFVETDVVTVSADDLLSETVEDLIASPHREAVVLDESGRCEGIVTRSDIVRSAKRRVILVDHNETAQAVAGIEEATVVEIVDHHRVGDVQTSAPIMFLNLPLGSTATIVAERFKSLGVEIPKHIAAILLSAIMTDTVLLKSPTATPVDRTVAVQLGAIIGEDPLEFGLAVFRSRGAEENLDVNAVVSTDAKEFHIADDVVVIAQHETVDLASVMAREDEIQARMNELVDVRGYDTVLLMVTDIVAEGSQLMVAGKSRLVERAFEISFSEGSVWVPGILSRKKQVASRLIEYGA